MMEKQRHERLPKCAAQASEREVRAVDSALRQGEVLGAAPRNIAPALAREARDVLQGGMTRY